METHGDIESLTEQEKELQKFLLKMSSPIIKKPRKDIKTKYFDKPPHPAIHNHHTIKWLRQRVNGKTIEKSVMSLMPNNGQCMIEEDQSAQKYKLKQFLKDYYKKADKFKNIEITPKYFFSELIMNKIKKLRDIFLEFDEDGSRKLEIDEMVIMFKTNNIKVVQEDLKTLFFKDNKKLQEDDLFLDFYQFMEFALNKECDQDFRIFMRKLKNKPSAGTESKGCLTDDLRSSGIHSNRDFNNDATQSIIGINSENAEEALFLPMNFNLLLDYFNNKGKQRVSMSKIQEAIEIMTRIIDGGIDNFHAKDKEKETINHSNNEDTKSNESSNDPHEDHNKLENEKELKKQKKIEENFKLHDSLDCRRLLEEFRKLFAQKPTADYEDNATAIIEKLTQAKAAKSNKSNIKTNINNSNEAGKTNNNKSAYNNDDNENKKKGFYGDLNAKNTNSAEVFRLVRNNNNNNISKNNNYECGDTTKENEMVFTNYIKTRLESKDPSEISLKHYTKYKSLLLAFEETKKSLHNPDSSSVASGHTGLNTKSTTGYTMSHKESNFNKTNNNNKLNNNFQPQKFNFRSNFYSKTANDWNKNADLLNNGKKQIANNSKNSVNYGSTNLRNVGNISGSNNNSPLKFGKTGFNFNTSRMNHMSKKIRLPDPQYNFNYQAQYFGVHENIDKNNNHNYGNFLLPLLNKKDKETCNHDNDFVPKKLMMELKERNQI